VNSITQRPIHHHVNRGYDGDRGGNQFIRAPCVIPPSPTKIYTSRSALFFRGRAAIALNVLTLTSHHLCTDTAALYTAVSEVAFLVQNRSSPDYLLRPFVAYLAYQGLSWKIHSESRNIYLCLPILPHYQPCVTGHSPSHCSR
jgi:hypothetical protein